MKFYKRKKILPIEEGGNMTVGLLSCEVGLSSTTALNDGFGFSSLVLKFTGRRRKQPPATVKSGAMKV